VPTRLSHSHNSNNPIVRTYVLPDFVPTSTNKLGYVPGKKKRESEREKNKLTLRVPNRVPTGSRRNTPFPWRSPPRRIDVGGKLLTNYLKELVSFRHWYMMDQTGLRFPALERKSASQKERKTNSRCEFPIVFPLGRDFSQSQL
jgi:hypothetical protein